MPTAILLSLAFAISACSPRLSPLTDNLREEYNWSEQELSKIQFYLSEDLVLSRERRRGTTDIVRGRVRVEDGREIEEVVFDRGTPGVVLFSPKPGNLAVGFDADSDERFLVFGASPRSGGRYVLLAKEWDRSRGKVTYGGELWNVSARNADVSLLLNLRRTGKVDRETARPSGRRIGG